MNDTDTPPKPAALSAQPAPLPYATPPRYQEPRAVEPKNVTRAELSLRSFLWGLLFFVTPIPPFVALYFAVRSIKTMPGRYRRMFLCTVGGLALGLGGIMFWVIGVPRWHREQRAVAESVACGNRLRQIGLASIAYAYDHDGRLPEEWGDLIRGRYIISHDVLRCPSDDAHISYVFAASGMHLSQLGQIKGSILACEFGPRHPEQNQVKVVYLDGSLGTLDQQHAVAVLQEQAAIRLTPTTVPAGK